MSRRRCDTNHFDHRGIMGFGVDTKPKGFRSLMQPFRIQGPSGQTEQAAKLTLMVLMGPLLAGTQVCRVQMRRLLRIWLPPSATRPPLAWCRSDRGSCRHQWGLSKLFLLDGTCRWSGDEPDLQRPKVITGSAIIYRFSQGSARNLDRRNHSGNDESCDSPTTWGSPPPLAEGRWFWAMRKVAGWNLSSSIFLWAHLPYYGGPRCNLVTRNLYEEESFHRSSCCSSSCQRLIFYRQNPPPVCVFQRTSDVEGSTGTDGQECETLTACLKNQDGLDPVLLCHLCVALRVKELLVTFLVLKSFVATGSQIPLTTVCNGVVNVRPQQRFLHGGSTPNLQSGRGLVPFGNDTWEINSKWFLSSWQIPKVFLFFSGFHLEFWINKHLEI